MSYDVSLAGCWGCGECSICQAQESELNLNYTYNVGDMIRDACGSGPNQWNGKPALEVAAIIATGLSKMEKEPSKYEAMNPDNGWGDFEGCKEFLRGILKECERYSQTYFRCF